MLSISIWRNRGPAWGGGGQEPRAAGPTAPACPLGRLLQAEVQLGTTPLRRATYGEFAYTCFLGEVSPEPLDQARPPLKATKVVLCLTIRR